MKSINYILVVLLSTFSLYATILTVDNKYPSAGQFTTLQAAQDAAIAGDTIYVYPSQTAYSAITLTKKLIIIGNGFDYSGVNLPNTKLSGNMNFANGSNGSKLISFGGYFTISIDANDIIIQRNQLSKLTVQANHIGSVILQNAISNSIDFYDGCLIQIYDNNDILFSNNYIYNSYAAWQEGCCAWRAHYGNDLIANTPNITISLINNIFNIKSSSTNWGNTIQINGSNHTVYNNIFLNSSISADPNKLMYNIGYNTNLPPGNNNIIVTDYSTLFVGESWHLSSNSPAKGTGKNNADIGIYGDNLPFVDGGFPDIPLIYLLDSDLIGSRQSGLKVKIKARSVK